MVNIGLVGCGGMGLRHAFGYAEARKYSDEVNLTAVCDRHRPAAEHVAGEVEKATGARPRVYADLGQLFDDSSELDAIDIVTSTGSHHKIAIPAFEHGLHVLTEKPMGVTVRACQEMVKAAGSAKRILSIAENYRRDPMNRLARALLDAGTIGRPLFMVKISVGGGTALMHNTGWRAQKLNAGSIVFEMGAHHADLMVYFLGDVSTVYAKAMLANRFWQRAGLSPNLAQFYGHRVEDKFIGQNTIPNEQEDTVFSILQFESGLVGEYSLSNASKAASVNVDNVHGSEGTMELPRSRSGRGPKVTFEGRREPLTEKEMLDRVPDWELDDVTSRVWDGARRMGSYDVPFEVTDRKLIAIEYLELVQAIQGGTSVEIDPAVGLKAVAIPYATLESSLAGAPVAVAGVLDGSIDGYQREIDRQLGLSV